MGLKFWILTMCATTSNTLAQPSLVPRPATLTTEPGQLAFTTVQFAHDARAPEVRPIAEYLAATLETATGLGLAVVELPKVGATPPRGQLTLSLDGDPRALGDEGYELIVTDAAATLTAATPRGLFWGTQTIRQLAQPAPGWCENPFSHPEPAPPLNPKSKIQNPKSAGGRSCENRMAFR
jgi:hexosaminidase